MFARAMVLLIVTMMLTTTAAAQLPDGPVPGTLVYIEDGRLFRYQDGDVEPICGVPWTGDDDYAPREVKYSELFDVAYAPDSGLVAFGARNFGPYTDHTPNRFDPDAATPMYLCHLSTGDFERISPDPVEGLMYIAPVFSPDETQIAWLADSFETTEVMIYDIASGEARSVYELPGPLANIPLFMFSQMRPLVWESAGLALRVEIEGMGEVLTIIDPAGGAINEQPLFPSDASLPEIAYRNLLTWAATEAGDVIVYALGTTESDLLLYYDPATDEHYVGRGTLWATPVVPLPDGGFPLLGLVPFEYPGGGKGLAATSAGPSTFNGLPGGFAFSPDGQYLAMLVNEGLSLRDGNDIYLLLSRDTFGILGYEIEAQVVGDTANDWNIQGPQRVFWGRSRFEILNFWPGSPLSSWSPNG